MKIYVASSQKMATKTANNLFLKTKNLVDFDFFFPNHLGDFSSSIEHMKYIDLICCKKLRESDILIAIYPFGYSVSVEIGRFLECNRMSTQKKYFIIFNDEGGNLEGQKKLKTEAMIMPHVDYVVNTIEELLIALKEISEKERENHKKTDNF